jgi:hypothetical protein
MELDFDKVIKQVNEFILGELKAELDLQISERLAQEIKHKLYYFDLKAKSRDDIKSKYHALSGNLNIDAIYDEVKNIYDDIILKNDYNNFLAFYKRKKISSRIGKFFRLKENELPDFVTMLSQNDQHNSDIADAIKKYIPDILVPFVGKKTEND